MHRRLFVIVALAVVAAVAGCGEKTLGVSPFVPTRGTVVLNGFGVQGVTIVPDTGSATSSIPLGATMSAPARA